MPTENLKPLSHLRRFAAFPRRSYYFYRTCWDRRPKRHVFYGKKISVGMFFMGKKYLLAFVRRSWWLHGNHDAIAQRLHCNCLRSVGIYKYWLYHSIYFAYMFLPKWLIFDLTSLPQNKLLRSFAFTSSRIVLREQFCIKIIHKHPARHESLFTWKSSTC
jgi:hypothetical protein